MFPKRLTNSLPESGSGPHGLGMGSKRLVKVSDYVRHGFALTVQCRDCGQTAKLDAQAISADAVKRNLSRDMAAIERRMKCSQCGSRNIKCGPGFA